jgi:hypothetical protein
MWIGVQKGPLFGLVANNIWTFDGATGGNATNQMLLNPFVSYHFCEGCPRSACSTKRLISLPRRITRES